MTYTFENGRMKVSAKRAFNTGDATDLALCYDETIFEFLLLSLLMLGGFRV